MRVNPALTGRATTGLRHVARSVTSGSSGCVRCVRTFKDIAEFHSLFDPTKRSAVGGLD